MTINTALPMTEDSLSVSIVAYYPDQEQFERTLRTLALSCDALRTARPGIAFHVYLVDNGGLAGLGSTFAPLIASGVDYSVIGGHGNVGYGRGHNLAIEATLSRFHLVLNPDIDLATEALTNALQTLECNERIGLLTPHIADETGHQQFLCRRFPTVLDLFVRGFLPRSLRAPFAKRLAHYELRDAIDDKNVFWDPPIVSGCFMLYRTEVLKKLGGFDPRYFLYFEDYDLSLRTHEIARVAYVPSVRVLHHGGDAARKGFTHIKLFITSAIRFFNRFGWRWL
jgi:GT2 family glycosyltransferase